MCLDLHEDVSELAELGFDGTEHLPYFARTLLDRECAEADAKVRSIGSNTGRLTKVERAYDPYTGIPRMSDIPVNVRPYTGAVAD